MDSIPWVPRVSPRGEEAGPARDELRVPGEEEDGEHAEKDEHGLFGKPATQRCEHRGDRGLWPDSSKGKPGAGAHWVWVWLRPGPASESRKPWFTASGGGPESEGRGVPPCNRFLSWGFHVPPASFLSIRPASLQTRHIIPRVLGTIRREKESETRTESENLRERQLTGTER